MSRHFSMVAPVIGVRTPMIESRTTESVTTPASASSVVGDPRTAEDVFIQAMTRALAHIHDIEEPAAFFTYAWCAVRSVALDSIRSRNERDSWRALRDTRDLEAAARGVTGSLVDRLVAHTPDPEAELIATERRRMVRREVDRLSEPGRTLVRLYFEAGCTLDQIAEATHMSRRSAIRKVGAARVLLAARLRGLELALDCG